VPLVAPFGSIDLQLSYRWSQLALSVNVVNIFDQSPPFVDSQYGYDRFNMQPLGRVAGLTVTESW
jgi:outer membrane receptor protein involved in Fe transport